MKIILIFRSVRLGFHSIENVFDTIRPALLAKAPIEFVAVEEVGFKPGNITAMRRLVKSQPKNTVYHVTGDIHYVVFGLPRKRTVLTIHDCVFIKNRRGLKGWVIKKLYLDWPVKYVRYITAISEKTKREIISLTGCDPDKIRVVNNPVSQYIERSDKPFNKHKPVLLFIGSQPNKNLNRVIEALKGFPCFLNIIGAADEVQQQKLRSYEIDHTIEKDLSNGDMAVRYQQSDIVLFPSLYEGFGLPVIEGFKAGRAVLTSDISPLKELSDGAAWLVNPYSVDSIRNTLSRIVNEEDTRNRRIEAGFLVIEQYSPEVVASAYWQIYNDLGQ